MPEHTRILIVDDHRDGADLLGILFETDGYIVTTLYDGWHVVETVLSFQPDVILMDISLPGIDGYEAARRIRAVPGGERMVMVAVTGWGDDQDRLLAERAGYNHHVVKPVRYEELRKYVESAAV